MLRCNDYTVVDIETTGFSLKKRKIIEVALLKVRNGKIIDTFSTLVNPLERLEERIINLTGIKDEDLIREKSIEDIIEKVIKFIDSDVLLGHSVVFDYSFLKRDALKNSLEFDVKVIDTLDLCKLVLDNNRSKSLVSACEYFNIKINKNHRALEDAYNTHLLYQELLRLNLDMKYYQAKVLNIKIKKEKKAKESEKEYLRKLLNYHKISMNFDIDKLSSNDIARIREKINLKYGYIK